MSSMRFMANQLSNAVDLDLPSCNAPHRIYWGYMCLFEANMLKGFCCSIASTALSLALCSVVVLAIVSCILWSVLSGEGESYQRGNFGTAFLLQYNY